MEPGQNPPEHVLHVPEQVRSPIGSGKEKMWRFFIYLKGNLCATSSVEGSALVLGGLDSTYYTGTMNWIPLYQASNFWNIQIQR